ncbi:S-adenosyl-L-methionine-dependent methyltransferase [Xylariaceae sp. FL0594]|nr:S-adenosyl-L-methionine-dependent methyltransferase [Xylariaceae sp. FL0594]
MAPSATEEALALIKRIEQFHNGSSGALETLSADTRRHLSETARKLSLATEAEGDTVHRIVHSPLQLPLAVVGVETQLFDVLAKKKQNEKEGDRVATIAELASSTNVDPVLMRRLLRYYQSFGIVDQLEADKFRANNITQALVSPGAKYGVPFYLGTLVPAFNALPKFLREKTGYANFTDGANCPWYMGHNTDKQAFEWVKEAPNQMNLFMGWMVSQRDGLPMFLDVVDFEKEFAAQGVDESTPVFVDIGGAMGHQCIALRKRYPNLTGRVILQDLDQVIQQVKARPLPGFEGIETQSYSFFTPEPVKGARAYYLRNILHDWPDDKCVEILTNIKSAMTAESRILIDEMVLPEKGAPWRATQLDWAMGSCFAAMERSRSDWDSVLEKAGLKIVDIWKYTEQLDDSIIVAVPK